MEDMHLGMLSPEQTLQMHQAGHIGSGQDFRTGPLMVEQAVFPHHGRNGRFRDGKRPSEATALVRTLQFTEANSFETRK